ncbi:YhgN family NAAT transporter [Buchnera aphidicola (Mindarus keteleerifoliae)]|uniref:YhgN family NAAT transporter n=1 Tax=Buchnera aphidicola TaxID=9 RepID=UPI0031B71156
MKEMVSTVTLLILIMDPLGNLPIFMSILKDLPRRRRRFILLREMIISLLVMLLFLFLGEKILTFLNLRTEVVSISGGIILFLISIKMIFPEQSLIKESKKNTQEEPFIVPLAIPLVAGPSLLATLMLMSHQYPEKIFLLSASLIFSWFFTLIVLLLSGFFLKILGSKGVNALERLMGLILIMLSVQMFLDGISVWFKL